MTRETVIKSCGEKYKVIIAAKFPQLAITHAELCLYLGITMRPYQSRCMKLLLFRAKRPNLSILNHFHFWKKALVLLIACLPKLAQIFSDFGRLLWYDRRAQPANKKKLHACEFYSCLLSAVQIRELAAKKVAKMTRVCWLGGLCFTFLHFCNIFRPVASIFKSYAGSFQSAVCLHCQASMPSSILYIEPKDGTQQ